MMCIYHFFSIDVRNLHNGHISVVIVYFLNTMFLHMTLGNLWYFNPVTMCFKEFNLKITLNDFQIISIIYARIKK